MIKEMQNLVSPNIKNYTLYTFVNKDDIKKEVYGENEAKSSNRLIITRKIDDYQIYGILICLEK